MAVRVRGLSCARGGHAVLDGLDLDLAGGEFVVLLGRSGSGKTTLLRCLAGLDPASADERVVAASLSLAFQEPRLLPWRPVWQNVALGLPGHDARASAEAALAEVGLTHRTEAWPLSLSGGEAQRVALARALARRPALLLLDEPFAALDALTRLQMQELLLLLWQRHGCAVLLVTHDVDEALRLADRVVVLQDARIGLSLPVPSPRPRPHADPALAGLRLRLLRTLGAVEQEAP